MNREELEKMKLDALRTLGTERGHKGISKLSRGELIDLLARNHHEAKGIVERAREAVVEVAHKMEEKAHEIADQALQKMKPHHTTHATPPARGGKRGAPRPGFDIPSSTVHPHAEELETLSMARLYHEQGQLGRALEIY